MIGWLLLEEKSGECDEEGYARTEKRR